MRYLGSWLIKLLMVILVPYYVETIINQLN